MVEQTSKPEESDKKLTRYTKEEIEKQEGEYDQDGFYILTAGGFIDPNGY